MATSKARSLATFFVCSTFLVGIGQIAGLLSGMVTHMPAYWVTDHFLGCCHVTLLTMSSTHFIRSLIYSVNIECFLLFMHVMVQFKLPLCNISSLDLLISQLGQIYFTYVYYKNFLNQILNWLPQKRKKKREFI